MRYVHKFSMFLLAFIIAAGSIFLSSNGTQAKASDLKSTRISNVGQYLTPSQVGGVDCSGYYDSKYAKVYNVSTSLNVRSGPGTSYSLIGSLGPNEQVLIIGYTSGWTLVSYYLDGTPYAKAGWVNSSYITTNI